MAKFDYLKSGDIVAITSTISPYILRPVGRVYPDKIQICNDFFCINTGLSLTSISEDCKRMLLTTEERIKQLEVYRDEKIVEFYSRLDSQLENKFEISDKPTFFHEFNSLLKKYLKTILPENKSDSVSSSELIILPGNVRLELVKIPAGSFLMGSTDNEPNAYNDEKPQHRVTLQEYYLGKYSVTQEQYQTVMGNNPSFFKGNSNNPVEQVSWHDAQAFCRKLKEITGKDFRLPTEAEWEYACRAGTQTSYCFGDGENQLGDYAWYSENSGFKTHPVGQKKPNAWGLYDMHGNVWEWCADPWHDSYANKPQNIKDNGSIIWSDSNNFGRVLRGGSCSTFSRNCRSAVRLGFVADSRVNYLGFRLAINYGLS